MKERARAFLLVLLGMLAWFLLDRPAAGTGRQSPEPGACRACPLAERCTDADLSKQGRTR